MTMDLTGSAPSCYVFLQYIYLFFLNEKFTDKREIKFKFHNLQFFFFFLQLVIEKYGLFKFIMFGIPW
jgi:hypothetical protein